MIHFGTRAFYKKAGYVAEFCPLCREIKAFIWEHLKVAYFLQYLIRVSPGKIVGYYKKCKGCGVRSVGSLNTYDTICYWSWGINRLIAKTSPWIFDAYQQRLEIEERLPQEASQLSLEEKRSLLFEPFNYVNEMLLRNQEPGAPMNIAFLFIYAFRLTGWALFAVIFSLLLPDLLSVFTGIAVFGIMVGVFFFDSSEEKRLLKKCTPKLAKSIAVLAPEEDEVENLLTRPVYICEKIDIKIFNEYLQKYHKRYF